MARGLLIDGEHPAPLSSDATPVPSQSLSKPDQKPVRRRDPLTDRQKHLAEKYLPMAKALAKPLKLNWPLECEEFESAALLALGEAAQSFDPDRNVKFATFARFRICGALRDVQRALVTAGWRGDADHAPLLYSLTYGSEEEGLVVGSEPDRPVSETVDAIDFVEYWLRKLPSKHAAACRELYINGCNQGEAAERLGCSRSRLSFLNKEAMEMLNDAWAYEARAEAQGKGRAGIDV
jgi:RNA polymerase sigma factor (sigma-70 family)